MAKNLVSAATRTKSVLPEKHAEACSALLDSARLVSQYNTVWLLTQHLFYKTPQNSVSKPVDAIINQSNKLDEQMKLHIVKLVLLET